MRGRLVSLSGIDGAGKSSQIKLIQEHYKKQKMPFFYLWTRGGNTPGVEVLKKFGRSVAGKKLPPSGHSAKRDQIFQKKWVQRLWLIIAIIDLIRIYAINIRWKLWSGTVVVCDRYLWDTLIDFKLIFPGIYIEDWTLWKILVWLAPVPSVEYLLMIPIKISEQRCLQKYEPFPDTIERKRDRYKLYKSISTLDKWIVIDATQSSEAVFSRIQQNLP